MFLLRKQCIWFSFFSTVFDPVDDTTPLHTSPSKRTDVSCEWKSVSEIVLGKHETIQRFPMHIPVSIPNAIVVCDDCLDKSTRIQALPVEFTVNTVHKGKHTVASVITATGSPLKLKNGVFRVIL